MTKKRVALIAALAWTALVWHPATARSSPGDLQTSKCVYAKLPARCGTFEVPEDRTVKNGRSILLNFVVIPAAAKSPVAVVPVAGGPGQSIVDVGADFVGGPLLDALHPIYDFLFVDQRGTGHSHPLNCNIYPTPADMYAEILPLAAVRACRTTLAKASDLNAYGSSAAADDLNALRSRLGYRSLILYGGSYGTTESLVYLRRHGDTVKNAVLEGVAPPFFVLPLPFLQGAQHAFDDLASSCAADVACNSHFPNFRSEFASLLEQSTKGIPLANVDPKTHVDTPLMLMRPVFADRMRQAMYAPDVAAFLPAVVHAAATGDTGPLGKLVAIVSLNITGSLAMGENISVDCQEFVPFITDAEVDRLSQGSFMAHTIVDARRASCDIWKVKPVAASFVEPVRSDVPVLMMSGKDDPATPPQYGTRELAYLPHGHQVLIPNAGHNNDDPCLTNIEIRFMQTSSSAGLDDSCAQKFARPKFRLEIPSFLR